MIRKALSDQSPKWRPSTPTTVPPVIGASGQQSLVHPVSYIFQRRRLLPLARTSPARAQPSPQLVDRVAWRRAVARGAHLGVGEGQGALVVEEAPDPRVGGFAEQYHVPTTGLIGSGMGGWMASGLSQLRVEQTPT